MVFEPLVKIDVDIPKTSLAEWILKQYRQRAAEGKTALVWADKGTEISYGDLLRDAVQVATALKAMGAKSGDTMGVVAKNSPELFPMIIGCFFAGVKVAASVFELGANELRSNFEITKPNYILTRPEKTAIIQEAISDFIPKPEIIELDEKKFKDILAKGSDAKPDTFTPAPVEDPSTHVFACMFSSGTTGKQKAIVQSDYNFVISALESVGPILQRTGSILCASQPSWISWYYMLSRSVITDRTWLFTTANDALSILDFMHKYKPTTYICPPSVIYDIRDAKDKYPGRWDTTSVKDIITGGDRFLAGAQRQLSEQIKINIYQEYGSTEIGYVSCPDVQETPVWGSAGRLVVPIRLVNPDTEEEMTEPYQVGEVRGRKTVMTSYLGNPQATAEAFDKHGHYKMGDMAYLDDRGNLFIVDRIKEMLKYKGFQVTPSELEEIIRRIPGVYDAAVAGKHDPIAGSLITAFVVKRHGANLTEEDVLNFMAKKDLHDAKKLRGGVIFIDAIPKNSNGKFQRMKLSAMLNGT